MRIAIAALLCVLILCAGCTSVAVGPEGAPPLPDVSEASGGAGPAFLVIIGVLALIVTGVIAGG